MEGQIFQVIGLVFDLIGVLLVGFLIPSVFRGYVNSFIHALPGAPSVSVSISPKYPKLYKAGWVLIFFGFLFQLIGILY